MRTFCLICWDGGSVDSISNSGYDSTDNELSVWLMTSEAGDLDDGTDGHDDSSRDDGFATSEHIATPYYTDSTQETAC